ncbi:hypothetical protein K2173_007474 [Erythroxylum novogranatense]|uniref:Cytochrome P450 n=1 Tax=Erythroxylum novogranatense TaxID=1862640 RepID=A0AAV8T6K3_9ROSI|nr:hypothetical protein K2173_007474 [Erythroxylum novogranatense]
MDLSLGWFSTAIAGLFLLVLCSGYFLNKSNVAKNRGPPEAAGGWPLIGHLPLLAGPNLLYKTLGAMSDTYGPIFKFRIGVHPTLVVSNWEIAKEIFTTNDAAVSSRPKFVAAKHLGYNYAMFGFSPFGFYWREIRKIATFELLSNRRLELLKHVRIYEVETSMKEMYRYWITREDGSSHVSLELKRWFGELSLNVILRMIAGKKNNGANAEGNEQQVQKWQRAIRDAFHYLGMFVLRDAVPFLGWLDVGGHEKAMAKVAEELDSILDEWLEEHKLRRSLSESQGAQDFMDVMLSVLDGKALAGIDPDIITKSTSLSLIAGGSDTSSVALVWAFSELLNNPRVLKKAQEELDHHVGRERRVTDSDISNLVYMQAIVKETLRLHPPAPLSAPREFIEDCTVGGYHISRGSWLMVNVWKIHRDPRVWEDPLEFKPERFLTTHKDVDVRGHNYELMPFGSGRRVCPGISFGLQMLHLVLATYLQAFEYSTPGSALVDMSESTGLTNMKATPLDVLIAPRLRPQLYE